MQQIVFSIIKNVEPLGPRLYPIKPYIICLAKMKEPRTGGDNVYTEKLIRKKISFEYANTQTIEEVRH